VATYAFDANELLNQSTDPLGHPNT